MLIRLLVGLSGSRYSLGPRDERDFPDDEAKRLVDAGFAVPVDDTGNATPIDPPAAPRTPKKRKAKADVVPGSDNG